MRKVSEEEALAKGFDPAVSRVRGELEFMDIVLAIHHDEYSLNFPVSVDCRIHSLDARIQVPAELSILKFKATSPTDKRIKARFLDAVGLQCISPEYGILLGVDTALSEAACRKLLPYVKDECSFVPTVIEGAPEPYYIMWVHTICDALDEEHSVLGDASNRLFPGCKRPQRAKFHLEKINAKYLFRLPQWKYALDGDLALPAFRELVKKLKITGFNFRAGGSYGPLLK